MTEDDWLNGDDWQGMLAFMRGKLSKREHTLYVCAGLRQIWDLLYHDDSRIAVGMAEREADGWKPDKDEGFRYWLRAEEATYCDMYCNPRLIIELKGNGNHYSAVERLLELKVFAESDIIVGEEQIGDHQMISRLSNAAHIAWYCLYKFEDGGFNNQLTDRLMRESRWPGVWLIREIFGNPFRNVMIRPEWLAWDGGAIPAIAEGIYDERAFNRLPILADALEDAGCDEAAILDHCRQPGNHARGCWVIDLLLGRR
ncbi:hypothetical protein [Zavarzinella formosa]|uniref:hypothetical protein n=1 Tax=Zavarzinella formosa TaxID=360055 RepID=UPI0003774707|nr:hypothetical protein [Zavarzinella formosa]